MEQAVTRAEIVVDGDAIRDNVARLRSLVAPARMMAVVKADGYGHGLLQAARAARAGGADWLGVAVAEEALALRAAGDTGPLMCWLSVPGEDLGPAVAAGVDVSASDVQVLDEIAVAAAAVGGTARVHLKIDTGLSRGGAGPTQWRGLVERARELEVAGAVRAVGVWSHLACADEPEHPANDAQEQAFTDAVRVAEEAGLELEVRHLANSAGAVLRPSSRFDLVRCGIATYGLDPAPGRTPDLGLAPAMTVRARLALVKTVPAGAGVSYGHTWRTERPTVLGLVPTGYAEGLPRVAGNRAEVWVAGARRPVRGRICMDQFVCDLGPADGDGPDDTRLTGAAPDGTRMVGAGEPVTIFGPGAHGEPTAQDWAEACDTISYEIVTRIGGRFVRRHVGEGSEQGSEGSGPGNSSAEVTT